MDDRHDSESGAGESEGTMDTDAAAFAEDTTSKLGMSSSALAAIPFIDGNEVSSLLDENVNRELKPAGSSFLVQQQSVLGGAAAAAASAVDSAPLSLLRPPLVAAGCSVTSTPRHMPAQPSQQHTHPAAAAGYRIVEVAPPSPRQRHLPKLFIPDCSIQQQQQQQHAATMSGGATSQILTSDVVLEDMMTDDSFNQSDSVAEVSIDTHVVDDSLLSVDSQRSPCDSSEESNCSAASATTKHKTQGSGAASGVRRKFRSLALRNCRKGGEDDGDIEFGGARQGSSQSASLENVSTSGIGSTFCAANSDTQSGRKNKRPWSKLAYRFRTKLKSEVGSSNEGASSVLDVGTVTDSSDCGGCVCTGYKRTEERAGELASHDQQQPSTSRPRIARAHREPLIDLSKLNLSDFPTQEDIELESTPIMLSCVSGSTAGHQQVTESGAVVCVCQTCSSSAAAVAARQNGQCCAGTSSSMLTGGAAGRSNQPYPSVMQKVAAAACGGSSQEPSTAASTPQQQQQQAVQLMMQQQQCSGAAAAAAALPHSVHTQIDYIHCLVPDLRHIANCNFYWGVMDRYEAERLLDNKPEGTFLLRDSAQEDFLFSVSFRRYGRSLHARIEQWNYRFSFDSHDPGVFASATVCGLIEHYKDPMCCLFFEPMLTIPLNRNFVFSLQHLCRSSIVSSTTYDGVSTLPIPKSMKQYLREYHYKQKVRVRRFELDDLATVAAGISSDHATLLRAVPPVGGGMLSSGGTCQHQHVYQPQDAAVAPESPTYDTTGHAAQPQPDTDE